MWHFQKIDPVDYIINTQYIAFVGAGGKSSLIEYLARETAKQNKKTVITTTTKIYAQVPYVLLTKNASNNYRVNNPIRIGRTLENGKLTAVTLDDICKLGDTFDTILIEADGAKGKPLKYPAPHEPVVPPFSGMVFVIAGLDGLFGQVNEKVFRWEILGEKGKLPDDGFISPEIFGLFFTDEMLLKDIGAKPCTIVLNKYDACSQRGAVFRIAKEIIKKTGVEKIVVASLAFRIFYELRYFTP